MSRIDQLRQELPTSLRLAMGTRGGRTHVLAGGLRQGRRTEAGHHLGLFKETTEHVGHHWHAVDFTNAFADWLCSPPYSDYAESYYESPTRFGTAPMAALRESGCAQLTHTLQTVQPADDTVVAVYGVASLFGFLRISEILPMCENAIRGRLLVFFPGVYEQDNYRLLDARDGWNYHAVPITPSEGEMRK